MYVLTIILFIALVSISSYSLGQIPYALIMAVISTPLMDVALTKFYLKQSPKIPFSAIITGLIIGFMGYNLGVTSPYPEDSRPYSAASIIVTLLPAVILLKEKPESYQKIRDCAGNCRDNPCLALAATRIQV